MTAAEKWSVFFVLGVLTIFGWVVKGCEETHAEQYRKENKKLLKKAEETTAENSRLWDSIRTYRVKCHELRFERDVLREAAKRTIYIPIQKQP